MQADVGIGPYKGTPCRAGPMCPAAHCTPCCVSLRGRCAHRLWRSAPPYLRRAEGSPPYGVLSENRPCRPMPTSARPQALLIFARRGRRPRRPEPVLHRTCGRTRAPCHTISAKNIGLWRPTSFFMSTRTIMQLFRGFSVYIMMWKTLWIMCITPFARLIIGGCPFVIRTETA